MNTSYDNTIGGWEELLVAARQSEGILPAAEALLAALERHLQEAKAAKVQQVLLTAARQVATKELNQSLAACSDMASRLRHHAKSVLGPRDERLAQFGVAPIKSGFTRKVRTSRKPQSSAPSSGLEAAK